MQESKNSDTPPNRYARLARSFELVAICAPVCALAVYFVYFTIIRSSEPGGSGDWGTFGDFLSGVAGTVVAAVTLIALAHTLRLQAEELGEAKKQIQHQTRSISKQSFETTFFHLLTRFTEITNDLRGQRVFERFSQALSEAVATVSSDAVPDHERKAALREAYLRLYSEGFCDLVGPYFRMLYFLLRFVHKQSDDLLTKSEKINYINIVRSQFNSEEHLHLFLDVTVFDEGQIGLQSYVENYGLLKHMRSHNREARFPSWVGTGARGWLNIDAFSSRNDREHRLALGIPPPDQIP